MVLLIVGPSGSGKTALSRFLKEIGFQEFVSVTTRKPRQGEVDGVSYHFLTEEQFNRLEKEDALAEKVEYRGNKYGVTLGEVEQKSKNGDCYCVVDRQGMRQFKSKFSEAKVVFITAPIETLISRMYSRGDSEEAVKSRLNGIVEEATPVYEADCIIYNNYSLEEAVSRLKEFVTISN